ncbi:hypothetical protein BGW36DRAFT_346366 [Talaromyces proteolyticus]|uniref:Uncharacterized protein n=1 Tax=Talaromyces proteolyticus TaxID=1131652 RepID=A0AAD4PY69_9EURO|nr:uncharacterized protein BGW36DRAFT_346366 [Talaromyces proteolyticus]KAH8694315.1 hypothetical protein BGW36DRAFT_346366 [Talaromyces proteolyticus]
MILFSGVTLAFLLLTGAFWAVAEDFTGNARVAHRCEVAAGACVFVSSIAGWYLLTSITLETVDFPIALPLGDLSMLIRGRNWQNQNKI